MLLYPPPPLLRYLTNGHPQVQTRALAHRLTALETELSTAHTAHNAEISTLSSRHVLALAECQRTLETLHAEQVHGLANQPRLGYHLQSHAKI